MLSGHLIFLIMILHKVIISFYFFVSNLLSALNFRPRFLGHTTEIELKQE